MDRYCFLLGEYPVIWFEDAVQLVRDKVDTIDKVYDIRLSDFSFWGSEVRSSNITPLSKYKNTLQNTFSIDNWKTTIISTKVEIPLESFAMEQFKQYAVVAADRDISLYGDCAKQNFMVWMSAMEHIVLQPGESRNANNTFAYLPGYCKGDGETEYMFYQGICGVSSMAYRASLLNPNIAITKRASHSKWYTRYYGEDIYGDDASLYEDIKQFEIRNDSQDIMLIKSKLIGDRPYLVMIHPQRLPSIVHIQKKQTGELSAQITRTRSKWWESQQETWSSNYYAKTWESN